MAPDRGLLVALHADDAGGAMKDSISYKCPQCDHVVEISGLNARQPAFPAVVADNVHDGMSLRDYFAAAALSGRVANPRWCEFEADDAEFAYSLADDMLAERDK